MPSFFILAFSFCYIPRLFFCLPEWVKSKAWDDENGEYGERDLEGLGGKEQFTSADVKKLAGILRKRIAGLEGGEDKKN